MHSSRNSQYMETQRDVALRKCREYFRDMDTNDDGKLCSSEFLQMIEYVGMELDTTELMKAYEKADHNKDGTISYKEFIDAYTSDMDVDNPGKRNSKNVDYCIDVKKQDNTKEKLLRKCREYFKEMDGNNDGRLDPREFKSMIEYVGMDLDVSELERAYLKADYDGNGTISFKEFLDAFCNNDNTQFEGTYNRRKITTDNSTVRKRSDSYTGKDLRDGCQYFWTSDADGDGKLSINEFANMLSTLGMKLNKREINKAFRAADENGDGSISFGEFIKTYLNKVVSKTITVDHIKDIFQKNDKNNNGFLSREECFHAMRSLGYNSNDESLDKLVKAMNKKQDGRISLNEYCSFLGLHKMT